MCVHGHADGAVGRDPWPEASCERERAERVDSSEVLELWRRAEASGDAELRGQLVERYLREPLERMLAEL